MFLGKYFVLFNAVGIKCFTLMLYCDRAEKVINDYPPLGGEVYYSDRYIACYRPDVIPSPVVTSVSF